MRKGQNQTKQDITRQKERGEIYDFLINLFRNFILIAGMAIRNQTFFENCFVKLQMRKKIPSLRKTMII